MAFVFWCRIGAMRDARSWRLVVKNNAIFHVLLSAGLSFVTAGF